MKGYTFNPDPPKAVTDYLKNKRLKPAFSWQDVWAEEHAYAFSVAKATQLNVLTDIREELQKALDEGTTYREFQKRLKPRLIARGWWGEKDVVDPKTGKKVKARLGSPSRLRTIYAANVRTARAAGQWERIQKTKDALPYIIYKIGPSENHRPDHVVREGKMAPVDDPVWQYWFAPNGWGCKCWHRQISGREAAKLDYPKNKMPPVKFDKLKNKRTGQVSEIPRGIDPGWHTNAGLVRQKNAEGFLAGAFENAPIDLARVAVADLVRDKEFLAHIKGEGLLFAVPVAVLPEEVASAVGAKTRIIRLSRATAAKHSDPARYPSPETWAAIQANIDKAEVYRRGKRLIFKINHDGEEYRFVVKVTENLRELFLLTFHRQRKGKPIKGDRIKLKGGE